MLFALPKLIFKLKKKTFFIVAFLYHSRKVYQFFKTFKFKVVSASQIKTQNISRFDSKNF